MPLAPDLLAEAFAVTVLRQKPGLTVQAIEAALECSGPQVWNPLLRAMVDLHGLGKLRVVESWLTSLLRQRPADELVTIEALIPERSVALARVAVVLRERQLQDLPVAPGADVERARILNNLGNWYSALGRRKEALGAAERAVAIRERLAKQNPDAFEPDLAGGLSNLGNCYSALGRREKALGAAQRAAEIYERLANQNPDAFEPNLAASLNNLGNCYSALGRREEALGVAERAVEIYERLANQNADAFEPDLATSLGTLGSIWQEESPTRAMDAFKRGVETLRRLFLGDPRAFARLMADLVNDYSEACESSGEKPDADLLAPIVQALKKLP